jgi:hypothetical protein
MFNSTMLEVAIGMAFVYLLLSLFCTAFNEAIAGILGSRARNLEKGIRSLFTDGLKSNGGDDGKGGITPAISLTEAIYDHGLVQSLYRSTGSEKATGLFGIFTSKLPSYIPSRTFSSALLDILFPQTSYTAEGNPSNLAGMLSDLDKLPESKAKQAICTLVKQAGGDMEATRQALEAWFDDGMDRAAGWYKRKTQLVLFAIGLSLAVGLNVDSIALCRTLWISPALRSYSIAAAEGYAKTQASLSPKAADDLSTLESLSLPIGWNSAKYPWMETQKQGEVTSQQFSASRLVFVLAGWFLTAIAMTLGAPFWFDLLNQFMVIRSTIKPREKSDLEASKDPKK